MKTLLNSIFPSPTKAGLPVFIVLAALARAQGETDALKAYEKEEWQTSLQQYQRMAAGEIKNQREKAQIAYGIGAASYQSGEFEKALPAFSDSLLAEDSTIRRNGHEGMGNTLYLLGETTLEKEPEVTIPRWKDGLLHLQAAQHLDPKNDRLAKNILFLRKRLLDLEEKVEKKKQQENKGESDESGGEGQGEGKPKDDEKGTGGEGKGKSRGEGKEPGTDGQPSESEGKGKESSKEKKPSETTNGGGKDGKTPEGTILNKDTIEKQDAAPQGKLEARQNQGKKEGKSPDGDKKPAPPIDPNQVTDKKTGWNPSEARRLLDRLADEDWKARPRSKSAPERAYKNW